jgi:hypothetical protein
MISVVTILITCSGLYRGIFSMRVSCNLYPAVKFSPQFIASSLRLLRLLPLGKSVVTSCAGAASKPPEGKRGWGRADLGLRNGDGRIAH